ncbi:MAG: type IV toxin-antitoxin system AbiEi family antitoxin domain-containing protein [Actinobacteria bacterium]|nr:type IV toxin-antitoxin system AbiEi family antitoxin domain-containing protein [Actinomycetota bacterium]
MREIDLVRELQSTGKAFFALPDLEKVTGLERRSLYVSLNRWLKKGVLERAAKGIYVIPGGGARVEVIAGQLYFPCYLSFESALSRAGVLNLVPYALTFATTKKTRKATLLGREVLCRQIKGEFFFGFEIEDGLYVARAEKALLDLIYMNTLGKASLPLAEMDFRSLSKPTLKKYARRFPSRVMKKLSGVLEGLEG